MDSIFSFNGLDIDLNFGTILILSGWPLRNSSVIWYGIMIIVDIRNAIEGYNSIFSYYIVLQMLFFRFYNFAI